MSASTLPVAEEITSRLPPAASDAPCLTVVLAVVVTSASPSVDPSVTRPTLSPSALTYAE